MELPESYFFQPLKDAPDTLAFRYDFGVKALDEAEQTVTEDADGNLIIEGYAAVFEGVDREGENFAEGAFDRGIKSFLNSQAALCFHHKHDKVLGKVLDLKKVEGKGLKMRARVDGAIKNHPELSTYYHQIKNGTLNGLSIGGFFKRALTAAGRKITDMDFTEISVTGVPVHTGPKFAVVAGKALASGIEEIKDPLEEDEEIREEDLRQINWMIDELNGIFARIGEGVAQRKTTTTDTAAT